MIPEGCRPDPAGFSGRTRACFAICSSGTVDRQRLIGPHPHSRHSSQHPAPSWVQPGDLRSFGPLSCTYVISFPGPHSELPVSSVSPVHRDRHSRPAPPAPVHAPAHLPCCVASPITHTPVRSESARLSAPRGGCCRFVMRSAGSSRQQVCDDRLGCVGILTATGLCSWRCSFVSGAHGMPNAAWRQCDVRATATASDGMLLSGVPILGCRSPPPLGPTFAIQEIGLGLLPCSSLPGPAGQFDTT